MNKNTKTLLTILYSHSYIFLFSLLTISTLCYVDPKFEACQPKTCGNNQSISYPFYIAGKQEPFCGFPGFALSCGSNGFPILNLSNTFYSVDQIFYDNQTLRVSNAMFSRSSTAKNKDCIPLTQNLTLPNQFVLATNQKDVILFFGCNLSLGPTWLQEHRIGCYEEKENETSSVLALYKDDKNVSFVSGNCNGGVADLVVENGDGYEKGNIEEVLRKGFLLNWTASDCTICRNTGGRCGFDSDIHNFRGYCTDRVHAWKCDTLSATAKKGSRSKVKLAIGLGVGVLGMLIIGLLLILILYKRKHATSEEDFHSRNSYSDSLSNLHLESGGVYFEVPIFSYKDLKEATNNFDHTKELGDGGFGTVYHGKLQDGREVAVKRLYEHNYRRVEQFMNEVQILTRLRHTNLVSLYGCTSKHSRELLLVYEYISNGTIACHLHGGLAKPGSLPWSIRMKIAIETAAALAYLHASHIIHRDVKTNNILLTKNFCVKVADFGLSRLFRTDVTHVSTAPQGTPGYVDPEYHQCYQLTSKSDVYSFGVVLIELISSKPAVDINRSREEINLSNLAIKKIQQSAISELVDPSLGFDTDNEVKRKIVSVAELAFQCLQRDKEFRPSMDEVLNELRIIETGKDEQEVVAEAEAPVAGVSLGIVHTHSTSPEWDEVGLLKNIKQPSSPNTVTDKWESKSTTPNVSV